MAFTKLPLEITKYAILQYHINIIPIAIAFHGKLLKVTHFSTR